MRYGKGPRGLIGITLKPIAMKTFAPHTEGHPRNDPTRDVDEKPSQGGNDAAHVLMTVVNSGISVKCYYIQ